MKVEAWLFSSGAFFFTPLAFVYGFITNWKEPLGMLAIGLTGAMCLLVGGYFWVLTRRIDPRPEDDQEAEIAEGAGEQGMFAPYSWSPLWLGMGAALTFAGLAVGWWLFFIGAAVAGLAVILWVFEFYRGEHAH